MLAIFEESHLINSVLVTGGAGFIGSHLVDGLLRDGYKVRIADNLSTGSKTNIERLGKKVQFVEGDLAECSVAEKACQGVDAVLHHAAIPSVPRSIQEPLLTQRAGELATLNVLNACVKNKVKRIVFAASSSAYGDTPTLPSHEGLAPKALSPYAASKLACESYVSAFTASYGIDGISFRYFNIFGPRQDPSSPYSAVISVFLQKMSRGERPIIYGDGQQTRDFTFVENVVSANLLALKATKPLQGVVCNIGCGERVSLNELVSELNIILGRKLEPEYQAARTGDIKHSVADIALAQKCVGYKPLVTFKEGLRRLVSS